MRNPFTVLIALAVVIALALAVGFTYIVFLKNPGHVSRSISSQLVVESA